MGGWLHRLSDVNEDDETGTCAACGRVSVKKGSPNGTTKWYCKEGRKQRKKADPGSRARKKARSKISLVKKRRPYLVHRKDVCERCGFVPEHICQLDVDHIDGNHKNNDPANLQTLCANCHRLKTREEYTA